MTKKLRLGEILVNAELISSTQLRSGLAYQKQWGVQLGEALVTLGFISEVDLLKTLARQLQLPAVNLAKTHISVDTLGLIKAEFAEKHAIIPLGKRSEKGKDILLVATTDPTNLNLMDEIRFHANLPVKFVITTRSSILKAIRKFYFKEKVDFSEGIDNRIRKMQNLSDSDMVVYKTDKDKEMLTELPFNKPGDAQPAPAKADMHGDRMVISKEFQALLRLLIKKGVISRSEFINELKKL